MNYTPDPIIKNFNNIIQKWLKKKEKDTSLKKHSKVFVTKPRWVIQMIEELNYQMPSPAFYKILKKEETAYSHFDYTRKLTIICYNLYTKLKEKL